MIFKNKLIDFFRIWSLVSYLCLTNKISISLSNMNNASSVFNNNDDDKKENIEDILDVIFDYNGNGDDELTLRFVTMLLKNK